MSFSSDTYLMQPVSPLEGSDWNSFAARTARYKQYLDFYNGSQWREPRRPGERRLSVNYARAIIQKQTSYFMARPLSFEIRPNGSGKRAQEQAARVEERLRQIWDDNGLHLADYDAAIDAAVLGDGAFKITLQPAGRSNPLALPGADGPGGRVVVRAVEVGELEADFPGGNFREPSLVRQHYRLQAGAAREQFGPDRFGPAGLNRSLLPDSAPCTVKEEWTAAAYRVECNERLLLESPNPYGFIPYLIFPNRSIPRTVWGESDLEDLLSLSSELNVRVSVLSQLLQLSGNPVLVLENVESAENMRVGPGAVWSLPEGAKASLLEMLSGGGVELHLKYIELLYRMLHDLAESPSTGFGRDGAGLSHSGVALDIMLHPVVQRVNRKRLIWNEVVDRRNRIIMKLAGLPLHRSRVIWPEVLPRDRAAQVTQEVGLVASSIHSLQTARRALGDEEPLLENELIVQERAALQGQGQPRTHNETRPGQPWTHNETRGAGSSGVFHPEPVRLSGALISGLAQSGG